VGAIYRNICAAVLAGMQRLKHADGALMRRFGACMTQSCFNFASMPKSGGLNSAERRTVFLLQLYINMKEMRQRFNQQHDSLSCSAVVLFSLSSLILLCLYWRE